MLYSVIFHEKAHQEFIDTYSWYENIQKSLGERFKNEVEIVLDTITENPELFTKIKQKYRQAKVKTFPFSIVYELYSDESIIHIVAIYHIKRNPKGKFRKRKI